MTNDLDVCVICSGTIEAGGCGTCTCHKNDTNPVLQVKREDKYLVLKLTDVHRYLSETHIKNLSVITDYIANRREYRGREGRPIYIVCNQDEPYADEVWNIILTGETAKGE